MRKRMITMDMTRSIIKMSRTMITIRRLSRNKEKS